MTPSRWRCQQSCCAATQRCTPSGTTGAHPLHANGECLLDLTAAAVTHHLPMSRSGNTPLGREMAMHDQLELLPVETHMSPAEVQSKATLGAQRACCDSRRA
jgi:hypothetical protein